MEFLRPNLLWGLFLVLLPLWIHFFGNRPRKTKVIPSLMFLMSFNPTQRSKSKLKDLLVLLMRMLIITFVVLAIAGPKNASNVSSVQIDNHPASWSNRASWLRLMLDQLETGSYKLYDREGNFHGRFQKESLWTICKTLPYSTQPFLKAKDALTVSFGFAADVQGPALLPVRSPIVNKRLDITVSDMDQYRLNWQGNSEITLVDSGVVIARTTDSVFNITSKEIAQAHSLSIEIALDEITEDNKLSWIKPANKQRLILFRDQPIDLGQFAIQSDSLLSYSSETVINYANFDPVVLIGFEFIPAPINSYTGRLLEFQKGGQTFEERATHAALEHPFFDTYFIGPSLQNQWPQTNGYDVFSGDGSALLLVKDQAVAVLNGQNYKQSFVPKSWSHPYYTALKQWSLSNSSKAQYLPYLGNDAYNTNMAKEDIRTLELSKDVGLAQEFPGFHSEKMYLLLALFCALIALIFVKI